MNALRGRSTVSRLLERRSRSTRAPRIDTLAGGDSAEYDVAVDGWSRGVASS